MASSSICSLVYPSVDDDIDCLGKEPAAFRFPIPTTEATRRDSLIHSLTDGDSNVTVKRREGKPLLIKTARRGGRAERDVDEPIFAKKPPQGSREPQGNDMNDVE